MVELEFAAKYPFSSEAKEFVEGRKLKLGDAVFQRAGERVLLALEKGELPSLSSESGEILEGEIEAYAVARLLVSALKSNYHSSRYAIAEAKRVNRYLQGESDEVVEKVARELGLNVMFPWSLGFCDYLRSMPKSIDYKLVNMPLERGRVKLSRHKMIRVIEEAVKNHLERLVPEKMIPAEAKKAADELRKKLPKLEMEVAAVVGEENYPPCIRKMLEELRSSQNVPHIGRWFLAVYLLKVKMDKEKVIGVFRTAPDWNEQTTRYQVEHAQKRDYSVPGCEQVVSWGVCCADCRCWSPMKYRKGIEGK